MRGLGVVLTIIGFSFLTACGGSRHAHNNNHYRDGYGYYGNQGYGRKGYSPYYDGYRDNDRREGHARGERHDRDYD